MKYLKNTEANIHDILIMAGNFNIRDNNYDLSFLYHSSHSDLLIDIADLIDLCLSKPTNQVSTRYSDNTNQFNSVINLMFLRSNLLELDSNTIHSEWRYLSDYALLMVNKNIDQE